MTVTLWPLIALASCAIHFSVFALASRSYKQPTRFKQAIVADKARSWIVTGFTAPLVTLASLPFVYDLIRTGDIAQVARRPLLAMSTTVFFIAYLICDIVIGSLYYRDQIAWLTGWGHHLAYIGMLAYATSQGWSHIFALAAIEELPTALLAGGIIFPTLRSDHLFASTFFILRIVFHGALLLAFASPHGQAFGTQTGRISFVPALFFLAPCPLHIYWFANTIRGIRRRRRKATQQSIKVVAPPTEAVIAPTLTPDASPIRARVVSITQLQVDETKSLKDDLPSRRFGSPLTNR